MTFERFELDQPFSGMYGPKLFHGPLETRIIMDYSSAGKAWF